MIQSNAIIELEIEIKILAGMKNATIKLIMAGMDNNNSMISNATIKLKINGGALEGRAGSRRIIITV